VTTFNDYSTIIEHQETVDRFVNFCNKFLDLKNDCSLSLLDKPEEGMTTGCYNPVDKSIKVVSGPRALVDILRSIAHELVHAKQDQEMRHMPGSGEDGSPIENEAHALAGLIMRKFEKDNKHIYEQ